MVRLDKEAARRRSLEQENKPFAWLKFGPETKPP
jgi:hypothetical protein